jgi:hypothetical protein
MFNISLKQPDPGFNVILFQDDATTSTGYTLTGALNLYISALAGSYSGSAVFNSNVIELEISQPGADTSYGINYISSDVIGLIVSLTGDAAAYTVISTGYTSTGLFDLGISFIGDGTTSGNADMSVADPMYLIVSMSGASGSATTGGGDPGSAATFSGSVIPLNISLLTGEYSASVNYGSQVNSIIVTGFSASITSNNNITTSVIPLIVSSPTGSVSYGVGVDGGPLLLVVNSTGSSFSAGLSISGDLLIISGSIPTATGSVGVNYSGSNPSIINLSLLESSVSTEESPSIRRYAGDRFTCLSTDTKPLDVTDGALLHVLDTRYSYLKVSGAWIETAASWSGAGGGSGSYTDEQAQDAVGSIMTGMSGILVQYDDVSNLITITYTGSTSTNNTNAYLYTTFAGQTSVNVAHNFGAYPVVQILDSSNSVIIPQSIINNSYNDFTVAFSYSTTGSIIATLGSPQATTYTGVSTMYSVTNTDYTVNCTSGTFVVNLPTSIGLVGKIYNIKNSNTGTISVGTTSSQTIDAYTSGALTLAQYERVTVQSDGANWIII